MVKEFNDIYGTDESDLNSWNKICTVLDIDPLPKTLQEARDVSGVTTYLEQALISSSQF